MKLVSYQAPGWLLSNTALLSHSKIPKFRLKLVKQKTPIEKLDSVKFVDEKSKKFSFYIKRDDLTHDNLALQGNKLRKVEFLLADAIANHRAKHILSAGGLQSNHARVVAGVSSLLGLKSYLFLRSPTNKLKEIETNGNLLIDRLLDARVFLIEKRAQYLESIESRMMVLKEKIKEKFDEEAYIIPIGGSNLMGLFGYVEAFEEMISEQKIADFIDDIVVTSGSGGTMAGLAVANYLTGSRFQLHAFCVCDDSDYFYAHLKSQLAELLGEDSVKSLDVRKLVNIVECSKGLGYAQSTKAELDFIKRFFQMSGILLDPVYTGKTFYTLVNLLTGARPTLAYDRDKNAEEFQNKLKGNRILFIHTGGQLGVFDNRKFEPTLDENNVFDCFGDKIQGFKFK